MRRLLVSPHDKRVRRSRVGEAGERVGEVLRVKIVLIGHRLGRRHYGVRVVSADEWLAYAVTAVDVCYRMMSWLDERIAAEVSHGRSRRLEPRELADRSVNDQRTFQLQARIRSQLNKF